MKNIRTIRLDHGFNQETMAIRLGISVVAYSKIETGATDVNLSRLQQIADIFEITLTQLFAYHEPEAYVRPPDTIEVLKKIASHEAEILDLQRKVIELFEEIKEGKFIGPDGL